jgi:hypothetical protein
VPLRPAAANTVSGFNITLPFVIKISRKVKLGLSWSDTLPAKCSAVAELIKPILKSDKFYPITTKVSGNLIPQADVEFYTVLGWYATVNLSITG